MPENSLPSALSFVLNSKLIASVEHNSTVQNFVSILLRDASRRIVHVLGRHALIQLLVAVRREIRGRWGQRLHNLLVFLMAFILWLPMVPMIKYWIKRRRPIDCIEIVRIVQTTTALTLAHC